MRSCQLSVHEKDIDSSTLQRNRLWASKRVSFWMYFKVICNLPLRRHHHDKSPKGTVLERLHVLGIFLPPVFVGSQPIVENYYRACSWLLCVLLLHRCAWFSQAVPHSTTKIYGGVVRLMIYLNEISKQPSSLRQYIIPVKFGHVRINAFFGSVRSEPKISHIHRGTKYVRLYC